MDFIALVGSLGFPIAVAVWFMVSDTKVKERLIASVDANTAVTKELAREIREMPKSSRR